MNNTFIKPKRVLTMGIPLIGLAIGLVGMVLLIGFALLLHNQYTYTLNQNPDSISLITPQPQSYAVTSGTQDQSDLVQAVKDLLVQRHFPTNPQSVTASGAGPGKGRYFDIDTVVVDDTGAWAKVTVIQKYATTGEPVITEPSLLIAHKVDGKWIPATSTMPEFAVWLDQIPATFVSEKAKTDIRVTYNVK